jgi:hypothetical protein
MKIRAKNNVNAEVTSDICKLISGKRSVLIIEGDFISEDKEERQP